MGHQFSVNSLGELLLLFGALIEGLGHLNNQIGDEANVAIIFLFLKKGITEHVGNGIVETVSTNDKALIGGLFMLVEVLLWHSLVLGHTVVEGLGELIRLC